MLMKCKGCNKNVFSLKGGLCIVCFREKDALRKRKSYDSEINSLRCKLWYKRNKSHKHLYYLKKRKGLVEND